MDNLDYLSRDHTHNEIVESIAIIARNDYYHYCNNVIESLQCSVTYAMKYTSTFTMLLLCENAALQKII